MPNNIVLAMASFRLIILVLMSSFISHFDVIMHYCHSRSVDYELHSKSTTVIVIATVFKA